METVKSIILTIEDVRQQVTDFLVDYLVKDPDNTRELISTGKMDIPCLTKDKAGDQAAIDYFTGVEWFVDHLLDQNKDACVVLIQNEQMIVAGQRWAGKNLSRVIPAEVHRDDWRYQADFDALPWFVQADDNDIFNLFESGWGGDYHADDVARFFDDVDPLASDVLSHATTEEGMGFECYVNGNLAMKWIKENRPSLYEKIMNH